MTTPLPTGCTYNGEQIVGSHRLLTFTDIHTGGSFTVAVKDASEATIAEAHRRCRARFTTPSETEPNVRQWQTQDVPPLCWIRSRSSKERCYLITIIKSDGVWTANGAGNQFWSWGRLAEHDVECSTDRKTWHPCTVEEA